MATKSSCAVCTRWICKLSRLKPATAGSAIGLTTPMILQWNATLEQHFGSGSVLSIGYAATRGNNLLRVQTSPTYSDAYDIVSQATNGAASSYSGMQAQFRKRLSDRLQTQLSYTWSH